MNFIKHFIRFSRPHTVIGTTLSILALYLLALSFSVNGELHLRLLLLTLLSCLGANIYIVGLNQITDVDIDRINKPYLPLASGAFSMRTGKLIIIVSVILSLVIAIYLGRYLLLTVLLSLALGTAYSLPPLRLKRFHFWAAFCILAVRGLIVNIFLFLHFQAAINGRHDLPPVIWLLTATIFVYSIIIAWFKDIPDMEGDGRYRINTLSLKLGARRVFLTGVALLTMTGLALIILNLRFDLQVNAVVMITAHILLLIALWLASRRVEIRRPSSFGWYYQFIWGLFFLEYITFAAAGILA